MLVALICAQKHGSSQASTHEHMNTWISSEAIPIFKIVWGAAAAAAPLQAVKGTAHRRNQAWVDHACMSRPTPEV